MRDDRSRKARIRLSPPRLGPPAFRCGDRRERKDPCRFWRRLPWSRLAALARFEGHGEQFEAVIDQLVAELAGDEALQLLYLLVAELDDAAGLHVDQMVMMVGRHFLVARAAVPEIVARQDIGLL